MVGFTTSLSQLFSSLAVARTVKELNPRATVALGGAPAANSSEALPSAFPFVDHIVVGEGEIELLDYLQRIDDMRCQGRANGTACMETDSSQLCLRGVTDDVDRAPATVTLDGQPPPDYQNYAQRAEELGVLWEIPVEGSRGCWWDRRANTGDDLQACYFCAENEGRTYRNKSPEEVTAQVEHLSKTHQTTRFFFLDSILPHRGGKPLAAALKRIPWGRSFAVEARVSIERDELRALKDAGCVQIQLGIEGFCTAYLRRMNKGTSTIRNLQVMRWCSELEIENWGTTFCSAFLAQHKKR